MLARISHHPSAAAANLQQFAAFAHIGLLDVAPVRAPRSSSRRHRISLQLSGLATRAAEICELGVIDRKCKDVGDVSGAAGNHDEPIDTECDSRALGETVFEGGQQPLIDRDRGQSQVLSLPDICIEPVPLLYRVG